MLMAKNYVLILQHSHLKLFMLFWQPWIDGNISGFHDDDLWEIFAEMVTHRSLFW